jgi:hypothetical protein
LARKTAKGRRILTAEQAQEFFRDNFFLLHLLSSAKMEAEIFQAKQISMETMTVDGEASQGG